MPREKQKLRLKHLEAGLIDEKLFEQACKELKQALSTWEKFLKQNESYSLGYFKQAFRRVFSSYLELPTGKNPGPSISAKKKRV